MEGQRDGSDWARTHLDFLHVEVQMFWINGRLTLIPSQFLCRLREFLYIC